MEILVGYLLVSGVLAIRELMNTISHYFRAKDLINQGVLGEYFRSHLFIYNYRRVLFWPHEVITQPVNFICEVFLGMRDFQLRYLLCEQPWFQTYIVRLKPSSYYQYDLQVAEITKSEFSTEEPLAQKMKYAFFYIIRQRETGDILYHSNICCAASLDIIERIDISRKNFTLNYLTAKKYKDQNIQKITLKLSNFTDKDLITYKDILILD